ncbi:uncharacterized protein E0L32_004538 [Thyridium curvatum]|uniref:Rhodopsin domain-containing protein n=1 Tax=Thyridium curvatum TaxID=1093900 RepID=A0A507BE82_9PEZI|nr:uncharacterized protein E0L32_004538 [Thyridium curvatum]TPX15261.1 hypothetical protein E0L32_004538 [Thyridium curvatum]
MAPGAPPDPARAAESNLPAILAPITVMLAISLAVFSARLYCRLVVVRTAARDDWTMLAAMACAIGGWVTFIIMSAYGLGHHSDTISKPDLKSLNEASFWNSIVQANLAIAFLKISIAFSLLRLSNSKWYFWSLWVSIGFVVAYTILGLMTFFLHCFPMAGHWDQSLGAKCYPIALFIKFAVINTAFNITTDVFYATIPIPIIWKLQMKRKTRIYLIGILSLGYLSGYRSAVVMGILKAIYQIAFGSDKDKTFHQWVQFWGFMQLSVGIIAACAPTLKPLVSKALGLSEYSTNAYGKYGYGSQSRSRRGTGVLASGHNRRSVMPHASRAGRGEVFEMEGGTHAGFGETRSTAAAASAFYKGDGSTGERSGSEEFILGKADSDGKGGIMRTTEITVHR